jgi:DNA gyrase subunit B
MSKGEKAATGAKGKSSYSAKDISVLEGLEPVRKRPGMYIGTTGSDGLHHLIWEVFDNSRDEAMAKYADDIEVTLLPNNIIRVVDNGRGIPTDKHPKTKVSALETIMTTLHAGGKFGGDGYTVSGGLHGVGVSVVNALSEWTRAEVHKDGAIFVQEYDRGKKRADVKKKGKTGHVGTVITFKPDGDIFPIIEFHLKKILERLRQQAYLVRGMRVTVIDARKMDVDDTAGLTYFRDEKYPAPVFGYYFEGGLMSFVQHFNNDLKPVHKNIFYIEKTKEAGDMEDIEGVEIALQYVDDISSRLVPFANNIYNPEGGTHVTGFKTALTRTLNSYAREKNLLKEKDENLSGDDVLEGLTAVISVKLREVQFEGQTKAKLGSVEARGAVEKAFAEGFSEWLEEHPDDGKQIINKGVLAMRARKAAKAAKDSVLRKGALEGMTLPGKLADCQVRKADEAELFIVEGDSAGGTAKMGRDRRTQAILPLRGKILNIERARVDRALGSEQIKNIIVALGTAIGETFDIEKIRYHKIIIATDADVDGSHIRTLLLTLFYRYFKQIIEAGFLYIAQPPLYKVSKGKKDYYVFSDAERDAKIAEMSGGKDGDSAGIKIQRYKGLGEMNADEFGETTMDKEKRILKQVTIEDAVEADKIFDVLMGTDVPSRKSFIQSNAQTATIDL